MRPGAAARLEANDLFDRGRFGRLAEARRVAAQPGNAEARALVEDAEAAVVEEHIKKARDAPGMTDRSCRSVGRPGGTLSDWRPLPSWRSHALTALYHPKMFWVGWQSGSAGEVGPEGGAS
jgi:hypothetical protein